jgi:hypothetical protein
MKEMKWGHFLEEKIIRIMNEGEAIGNIREICRQQNIAEFIDSNLLAWRSLNSLNHR